MYTTSTPARSATSSSTPTPKAGSPASTSATTGRRPDGPFDTARDQLDAYFAGELEEFDLPLGLDGTPFQRRVWDELTQIPFAETISYKELALRLGDPSSCAPSASANGRNPISIVIPCHRVIGADGTLVGYGGGLERKRWLLDHEAVASGRRLAVG